MHDTQQPIAVYLEAGAKRTIAGALDWPGWCRIARDEDGALQALAAYGPRYALVMRRAGIAFQPPEEAAGLTVVERLAGTNGTDFGVPELAPAADAQPMDEAAIERASGILSACWQALDDALAAAAGKELRTGPRGGGRDAEKMLGHVVNAHRSYVNRLGWRWEQHADDPAERMREIRQGSLAALAAAAHGELPDRGPRGGKIWLPRYFVRRAAWHILDHVWELEDRTI